MFLLLCEESHALQSMSFTPLVPRNKRQVIEKVAFLFKAAQASDTELLGN